jgi:hypothetical protein
MHKLKAQIRQWLFTSDAAERKAICQAIRGVNSAFRFRDPIVQSHPIAAGPAQEYLEHIGWQAIGGQSPYVSPSQAESFATTRIDRLLRLDLEERERGQVDSWLDDSMREVMKTRGTRFCKRGLCILLLLLIIKGLSVAPQTVKGIEQGKHHRVVFSHRVPKGAIFYKLY